MSGEAKELRELARDIYELVGRHRIASIAWPAATALCEYLTLRARVMELEAERDYKAATGTSLGSTTMTQQAKSAIQALKASIDRLNQAKNDPSQLQQLVQEMQQHIQRLEQQLND